MQLQHNPSISSSEDALKASMQLLAWLESQVGKNPQPGVRDVFGLWYHQVAGHIKQEYGHEARPAH